MSKSEKAQAIFTPVKQEREIRMISCICFLWILSGLLVTECGALGYAKAAAPEEEQVSSPDESKHHAVRAFIADDAKAFAEFQEKVRVWQILPQKPPLSEEVRRFRVLADDAVQSKDFDKAASFYEKGLSLDPLWPAGQFNAALIYGELKDYSMAVIHMKRYLALDPNVKDARAYQDKIYIWEEKANEVDTASVNTAAVDTPTEDDTNTKPARKGSKRKPSK
jgi:tetratricopeptide (TPR) repeat protein